MAFKMKKATIYKLVDESNKNKSKKEESEKDTNEKKRKAPTYPDFPKKSILLNNDGEQEF
jgi:hypothetical protein